MLRIRKLLIILSSTLLFALGLMFLMGYLGRIRVQADLRVFAYICLGFWMAHQISPLELLKKPYQGYLFIALCGVSILPEILQMGAVLKLMSQSGSFSFFTVVGLIFSIATNLLIITILALIIFKRNGFQWSERPGRQEYNSINQDK